MNRILAAVLAFLLTADGVFTYWAIQSGNFVEQNPLMAPMAGSWLFPLYKVVTAVIGIILVGWLVKRFPRMRRLTNFAMTISSLFYLFILAANLWEVITL